MKLVEKIEILIELYSLNFTVDELIELLDMEALHISRTVKENKTKVIGNVAKYSDLPTALQGKLASNKLEEPLKVILGNRNKGILNIDNKDVPKITYESEVLRIKSLIKVKDKDNKCSVCSNEKIIYLPRKDGRIGLKSLTCPKCKGKKRNDLIIETDKELLERYIPNKRFRLIDFDKSKLELELNRYNCSNYINGLEDLINIFKKGELPKNSYFIASPDDFGKKYALYQMMKEAFNFGYNPSELIEISAIQHKISSFDFEEATNLIANKDVVFLDLNIYKALLTDALYYILNYCNKNNIPVVLISRIAKEELINKQNKGNSFNLVDFFAKGNAKFEHDYSHFVEISLDYRLCLNIKQEKKEQILESLAMYNNYNPNSNYVSYSELKEQTVNREERKKTLFDSL